MVTNDKDHHQYRDDDQVRRDEADPVNGRRFPNEADIRAGTPAAIGTMRMAPLASGKMRTVPLASGKMRTVPLASGKMRTAPLASGKMRTAQAAITIIRTAPAASGTMCRGAGGDHHNPHGRKALRTVAGHPFAAQKALGVHRDFL